MSCRDIVRPAVSVSSAPALDLGGSTFSLSGLGPDVHDQHSYPGVFDLQQAFGPNYDIPEREILSYADNLDFGYDTLAGDGQAFEESFDISHYLHQSDEIVQSAPEVQPSNSIAESTASLQPALGASA